MIIDYNAMTDKELRAFYRNGECCDEDSEGNPPYDYSEDIVFKCLKNPSNSVMRAALYPYPVNEKYCKAIPPTVMRHVARSSHSVKVLHHRMTKKQKLKVMEYDISCIDYFTLPIEDANRLYKKFLSLGMTHSGRWFAKHYPENIEEYIKNDDGVLYYLKPETFTDEFIDKYIQISPLPLLYAMKHSKITSELVERAVHVFPEVYLVVPEETITMRLKNFIYETNPLLLAKRGISGNSLRQERLIVLHNEEIINQLLDTDPMQIIRWFSDNNDNRLKNKLSEATYNKYVAAIEAEYDNPKIDRILKKDHSPEFIDKFIRNNTENWRTIYVAEYELNDEQLDFLVTYFEQKAIRENNNELLEKFLYNLKSCVRTYSPELVLKHPNLIFGCAKLDDELFEQIYEKVTTNNAATLIYNRTEQDHIKLFLKLKFG